MKIGEKKETVVALIDHDSEINLMSTDFYKKEDGQSTQTTDGRFARQQSLRRTCTELVPMLK